METADSWDVLEWTKVEAITGSMAHGMDEFLLPAEEVIAEGHGVLLVNTTVAGTLLVTNFRLLFVGEGPRKLIPLGTIPLATIEKFNKQAARVNPVSRQGDKTQRPGDKNPSRRLLQVIGKDMRIILFGFRPRTRQRRAIFDGLTRHMRPSRVWDLYAFTCGPSVFVNSDPRVRIHQEYLRLLGKKNLLSSVGSFHKERKFTDSNKYWRITDVNSNYMLCPTYPSLFLAPLNISDEELLQAATFRARGRLPVITWCHPKNGSVLARSSQPLVGIMMNSRSNADEKLVAALCTQTSGSKRQCRKLYIADARPRKNAIANGAMGGGSESKSNYSQSEVVFLGIDNIHAMRESFSRLRDYLDTHGAASSDGLSSFSRTGGWTLGGGNQSSMSASVSALGDTGWLTHIHNVLAGSAWIAALIHLEGASVLVHCSDGWDRTTQLISLSSLLLDPYYRTFDGFQALVEKDWIGFGHPFADRLGMPTISGYGNTTDSFRQGAAGGNASPICVAPGTSFAPSANPQSSATISSNYSPIFLQWVDCVAQLLRIYPRAFEFSSAYLVEFVDCVISCRFGNFLCNSEKERQQAQVADSCGCIWVYLSQLRTSGGRNHEHYNLFYAYDQHPGPLLPPAATLAPALWSQFHLRWACPSEAQGELEAQCHMMAKNYIELQEAKGIAEETIKVMLTKLQAQTEKLKSVKRALRSAVTLTLRASRENSAIKRAMESIGFKVRISSTDGGVRDIESLEEIREKTISMLQNDSDIKIINEHQEDVEDLSISVSVVADTDLSANLLRKTGHGICPYRIGESCKWPDETCAQMGSQFTGLRANYDALDQLSIHDGYFKLDQKET